MSEQLFRFVLLRPPVKQDLLAPSITLSQSSDFQQELDAKIKDNPNPRPSVVEVCYVNKDNKFKDTKLVKDPTADELAKNVMALGQSIDDLENHTTGKLSPTAIVGAVLSQWKKTPAEGIQAIPEGYQATKCFISILTDVNDKGERVLLNVGTQTALTAHEGGEDKTFDLAHETGSVKFTLQCERSVAKFQEWQQATYAKILPAYESKLAQHEQKIKSAELEADAVAEARNSATNQQIIHEELRKHSISIIRRDAYKNVGALGAGEQGIPDIDFDKAAEQGAVVRFFEQAFEWEQMSYALYGYYWGQRAKGLDRLRFNDPDTTFNEFLKAGMCRVVVPVRGGLLEHNELWTGGPLSPIASSTYLLLADELAARARKSAAEEAQGLPWDVYVPTSLVQLRAAGQLPKWERNADGVWKSSPANQVL
ncbi:MAG: hypothetical protein Q9193_001270 [Seirophora villosa]